MIEQATGYEVLQKELRELTGIDLSSYKETQMLRRLGSYLSRVGARDFYELAKRVRDDPEALEHLQSYLTINVSEFFRDPGQFKRLAEHVIPELLGQHHSINIWSAGCSIGAEPYSLAIILHEGGFAGRYHLLATDIDRKVLREAQEGIFALDRLKNVSHERLERFFEATGDGRWRVKPELKVNIIFRVHDLLRDPYPSQQHLILCRNVVIYFTEQAKSAVFHRLSEALAPGGYLLLGSTESLFGAERLGLAGVAPFLYRKVG